MNIKEKELEEYFDFPLIIQSISPNHFKNKKGFTIIRLIEEAECFDFKSREKILKIINGDESVKIKLSNIKFDRGHNRGYLCVFLNGITIMIISLSIGANLFTMKKENGFTARIKLEDLCTLILKRLNQSLINN